MNTGALEKIYSFNLGIKPTERVLIFTDRITSKEKVNLSSLEIERRNSLVEIAKTAARIGKEYAREIIYEEYPSRGGPAIEPPEKIWRAAFGNKAIDILKERGLFRLILSKKIGDGDLEKTRTIIKKKAKEAVNAVIALSNYSTSHTIFRKLLTLQTGARYASMPLFDASMLDGPMNVDYKEMKKRSRAIASALKKVPRIELASPNGTSLSFERGRRHVEEDTGDLRKPGSFGNLPAGEVYIAPIEGTAQGIMVLEWAATRKLESPVKLIVKDGFVTDLKGDEPFVKELEERFKISRFNANIAELGIGTNDKAARPDNILESEKILGTAHIALGDNSTFGGNTKAPFHQDFVFFKPTLTLFAKDGGQMKLIDNGSLQV